MRLIGAFATASAATTEVLHRREMAKGQQATSPAGPK